MNLKFFIFFLIIILSLISLKTNSQTAKEFFEKGNNEYALHNLDSAISNYTKVIKLDPLAISAYSNRAIAYTDKGLDTNAIDDYTQVIKLIPDNANAYYYRGCLYSKRGINDKAIGDFTKAINLKPDYAYAYDARGSAYAAIELYC